MHKVLKLVPVFIVLFLVGCQAEQPAGAVEAPAIADANGEEDAGSHSFTSGPADDGPDPAPDTGNVSGRITWNGEGAANLDVLLCQDFSSFSGCSGREFKTVTGEDGSYLFTGVDPGIYALAVRVFETDNWLYVTSGILSSADFVVEAGETLTIDTQSIFKLDLMTTQPPNQATVDAGNLSLVWEPYSDAAYYQVYLAPEEGDAMLVNERVDTSQVTVELRPVACDYRWSVEAFNRNDVKIAETRDYSTFRVTGHEASCRLITTAPADGAHIAGNGIVLDWEPHPMAVTYKILMWNDSDPDRPNVLDFVAVPESRFDFNGELAPARYVWSVAAYDESGDQIAGSEVVDFTVEP